MQPSVWENREIIYDWTVAYATRNITLGISLMTTDWVSEFSLYSQQLRWKDVDFVAEKADFDSCIMFPNRNRCGFRFSDTSKATESSYAFRNKRNENIRVDLMFTLKDHPVQYNPASIWCVMSSSISPLPWPHILETSSFRDDLSIKPYFHTNLMHRITKLTLQVFSFGPTQPESFKLQTPKFVSKTLAWHWLRPEFRQLVPCYLQITYTMAPHFGYVAPLIS